VHPLLDYTSAQQDWLLETLDALVRAESPSTDKTAVDRCGTELARRLRAAGGSVEVFRERDRGDHLRAVFDGDEPQVMVLGHFDTVWEVGQIARMPVHEADGRLHGPGVYDMKAGIAVALLAMRALDELELSRPRVVMLFTTDEEIGSTSSRYVIEDEARRSRAVLVLEPPLPGGGAKTSRKGVGEFEVTVRGVAAHAGIAPSQGANAVHELAHQILALQALQETDRGLTVNVTVVSGGTRTNVIPDMARAAVDVRVPTVQDARRIENRLKALQPTLPGTQVSVRGAINRPPLERHRGVIDLYHQARECALELGKDLAEGATGGGSDGNFTAALGVPTLDGLGPEGDGAHALHEHVLLADLPWRAAFLARLLNRLGSR
jgi:glutamate carboxypeptidase